MRKRCEEEIPMAGRKSGRFAVEPDDVCQSVSETASREYQGWLPDLLDEQLYLSSSYIQKATGHVVAHTTNRKHGA